MALSFIRTRALQYGNSHLRLFANVSTMKVISRDSSSLIKKLHVRSSKQWDAKFSWNLGKFGAWCNLSSCASANISWAFYLNSFLSTSTIKCRRWLDIPCSQIYLLVDDLVIATHLTYLPLFFRRRDWYWVYTKLRARMSCSPLRRPSTMSWLTASCWKTFCCKSQYPLLIIAVKSLLCIRATLETASRRRASFCVIDYYIILLSNKAVSLVRHCCRIYLPDYSALTIWTQMLTRRIEYSSNSFFLSPYWTLPSFNKVNLCSSCMYTHILYLTSVYTKL